jgi:inositol transport system substrate-binding protein
MESDMKSIYILLTKSDTYVSKIIGLVTDDHYTHASISFEENLQPMYSFSRKFVHSPLPAGLRVEPLQQGFYKIVK